MTAPAEGQCRSSTREPAQGIPAAAGSAVTPLRASTPQVARSPAPRGEGRVTLRKPDIPVHPNNPAAPLQGRAGQTPLKSQRPDQQQLPERVLGRQHPYGTISLHSSASLFLPKPPDQRQRLFPAHAHLPQGADRMQALLLQQLGADPAGGARIQGYRALGSGVGGDDPPPPPAGGRPSAPYWG